LRFGHEPHAAPAEYKGAGVVGPNGWYLGGSRPEPVDHVDILKPRVTSCGWNVDMATSLTAADEPRRFPKQNAMAIHRRRNPMPASIQPAMTPTETERVAEMVGLAMAVGGE